MEMSAALKRKRKIRYQFRAIVHTIIINKAWISMQEDEPITSDVQKNLAIVTRKNRQTGILTNYEKGLIRKPVNQRTILERKRLLQLVQHLKCFRRYPPKVRARIAPHLIFIYIQMNRTLVKEGDVPTNVYYILNGEGVVTHSVFDQVKNEMVQKLLYIVGPGDSGGETAFLAQRIRTSTIQITKNVEALCLDSDVFMEYVYPFAWQLWNKKIEILNGFKYFKDFTERQKTSAVIHGQIKQYQPMETIYHQDIGILNYVYLVLSGECMILQCLKMKTKTVNGHKIYKLLDLLNTAPDQSLIDLTKSNILAKFRSYSRLEAFYKKTRSLQKDFKDSEYDVSWTTENHFTDVGSFRVGALFGLGEKLEQRAIMARTVVQCLLIPRYWLLEKQQNPGNMWQIIKCQLESSIPSREELFKDFLSTQKWQTFKKDLILSSLDNTRTGNPTKTEDIPLICRVIEPNFED